MYTCGRQPIVNLSSKQIGLQYEFEWQVIISLSAMHVCELYCKNVCKLTVFTSSEQGFI